MMLHQVAWRTVQSLIIIVISGAVLGTGWRLQRYLSTAPSVLAGLVWAGALFSTVSWILAFALEPVDRIFQFAVVPVQSTVWLIAWYLLRNIKRLALIAAQTQGDAAGSAAPIPAGWYTDPAGRYEQRYWDGSSWTSHVCSHGHAGRDELD